MRADRTTEGEWKMVRLIKNLNDSEVAVAANRSREKAVPPRAIGDKLQLV